jgi:hypothetical protein
MEAKLGAAEPQRKQRTQSKRGRRPSLPRIHKSKVGSRRGPDVEVTKRPEDCHISAAALLALHLVIGSKGIRVSEAYRHPNPNPSALSKVEILRLLPLVDEFQRVNSALQKGALSNGERRVFDQARGLGARSIMDVIRSLIDVDPTCVTYTPEQEFVVSLGDGLELALFYTIDSVLPKHRLRGKAIKWMIERGEGNDLHNLTAAIERAVAEGMLIPEHCFSLLRPSMLIRDNPRFARPPR